MQIPNEHHRFIVGKGGSSLKQLEANTGTRITLSKNGTDSIIVTGIKEDVDKACHEIQCISDRKVNSFNLFAFCTCMLEHDLVVVSWCLQL